MSGTVSFIDIGTKGTFTGGIARVNLLDRHTGKLPLVFDKAMQLEESPAMEIVSLALAKPYPFADALKVFKGDASTGAFSVLYDLFADLVIDSRSVALFSLGKVFQNPFSRLGLFGLQPGCHRPDSYRQWLN